MGRGEHMKGTGVELTGLAAGLDVGMRERGATIALAASLLITELQKYEDKRF